MSLFKQVLGSDYCKEKIAKQLNRAIAPKAKVGDRKSKGFKNEKAKINRV